MHYNPLKLYMYANLVTYTFFSCIHIFIGDCSTLCHAGQLVELIRGSAIVWYLRGQICHTFS